MSAARDGPRLRSPRGKVSACGRVLKKTNLSRQGRKSPAAGIRDPRGAIVAKKKPCRLGRRGRAEARARPEAFVAMGLTFAGNCGGQPPRICFFGARPIIAPRHKTPTLVRP